MKDDQLTLRVPRALARQLRQTARARGIPASQLVREAIQSYLAESKPADPGEAWRQVAAMVGSLELDHAAVERDALAAQLRRHNWRA